MALPQFQLAIANVEICILLQIKSCKLSIVYNKMLPPFPGERILFDSMLTWFMKIVRSISCYPLAKQFTPFPTFAFLPALPLEVVQIF
jgi:hypothetical protein